MLTIEFCVRGDLLPLLPRPYPAAKGVPEWYKNLPLDRTGPTVKRCPPFLDALTCGNLIPLIADVELTNDGDGIRVDSRMPVPPVLGHFAEQLADTPFGGAKVLKFNNPWLIRTPAGCSTLFLPPMNQPAIPYVTPLSAIVDTDTFYSEINFPFLFTLPVGQSTTIKAGTPIVHAIPFRRDEWKSEFVPWEQARLEQAHEEIETKPHSYREHQWVKKSFV